MATMTINAANAPVLFNVEHATRAGVQVVARDLSRAEAKIYLELARIERVPGRCVRVVLASRERPHALKLVRSTGTGTGPRRWPMTDEQRAKIMSEAEEEATP